EIANSPLHVWDDDFFTTKTRRHQVSDGNPLACAFGKLTICTTINRTLPAHQLKRIATNLMARRIYRV
ncbi:MAG: hypothetical protein ACAI35_10880, partial [Candidatus Methylacidiphilales bacterium]